ncbi:MAG: hypothetical protein M3O09_06355 [Acidobacteriota bacterium]|nr:hypothetical protein [Acidobacteriota bacterium]
MKGGLWRSHACTPTQRGLFSAKRKLGRPTQADLLLGMLREARSTGDAVELPAIMAAGIAQDGALFNELRSRGFVVLNEIHPSDSVVRSRYFLTFDPKTEVANGE